MPAIASAEDLMAELVTLTSVSPAEWADFMACSHAEQLIIAEGYREMSWTKAPDTFGRVLSILEALGMIASVVGGVAGAIGAVSALRTVLR